MAVVLVLLLFVNEAFIVDAVAEATYTLEPPSESLKEFVDDIGLFARNMPGVAGVTPLGENTFLYQTEKQIPLVGKMAADFRIEKSVFGDSVTWYDRLHQHTTRR